MKSEHQQDTKTETILSYTTDHVAFDHENLHCSKGNVATFLCQNKNCQNSSMICTQKDCECQQVHKKCLKTFSEEFFAEINKKIQPTSQIKERVDKIIDDAIDFISNLRDEIYLNLKYLGLNQEEKDLMGILNQKEYNQISGAKVWKICQKIYEEKQISSSYIIKSINSYWNDQEQKFKRLFETLRYLSEKEGRTKNIFKDSTIIAKDQDSQNLVKFFSEEISSVKLLYSASKSKYQMKKYHQECGGKKNLLVIVKGVNGKIFGGFWPNELPKLTSNGFGNNVVELSPKSFIFSLNNKEKFKLISETAFQNFDPNEGPNFGNDCLGIYRRMPHKYKRQENPIPFGGFGGGVFGGGGGLGGGFGGFGGNELHINPPPAFGFGAVMPPQGNPELTEHFCAVLEGRIYVNENYESNAQSRMKFAGTEEACFEIKQWEVYQVRFVEKQEK